MAAGVDSFEAGLDWCGWCAIESCSDGEENLLVSESDT
jgi:hypothetical protein